MPYNFSNYLLIFPSLKHLNSKTFKPKKTKDQCQGRE